MRGVGEYLSMLQGLLPQGAAWPRRADAILTRLLEAWAQGLAALDARAAVLLAEADPRVALELLADWERAAGLPDACLASANTIQERRAVLLARLTSTGGQTPAFFGALIRGLGYTDAVVIEYRPALSGVTRCGNRLGGAPAVRHVWRVAVRGPRVTYARTGASQCGDRLADIDRAEDLECLLRRLKPVHSELFFAYEGV